MSRQLELKFLQFLFITEQEKVKTLVGYIYVAVHLWKFITFSQEVTVHKLRFLCMYLGKLKKLNMGLNTERLLSARLR